MTDAQRLKKAREHMGLTQQQLADRIGSTYQNLSKYERGLTRPRYQTMVKIASALGTTVETIWQEEKQISNTDAEYSKALKDTIEALQKTNTAFDRTILNYSAQLTLRNKAKVLQYAADLLDSQKYQTEHPEQSTSSEINELLTMTEETVIK